MALCTAAAAPGAGVDGVGRQLCCSLTLEAFEAFAVGLQGLLGGKGELVAETLSLLLSCSSASGGAAPGAGEVVPWCLRGGGEALGGCGPEAVARALLLQRSSPSSSSSAPPLPPAARASLLDAAPSALASAAAPVAARLAEAVASALEDESEAASWLASLRPGAACAARGGVGPSDSDDAAADGVGAGAGGAEDAARGYARAAAALIERHRGGAVKAEAWEAAGRSAAGQDSGERRVCAQLLLPALVAASDEADAAERLSGFVATLLERGGRAEVADALSLAVSFHGPLLRRWRLASFAGDHNELGVRLIETGLRFGLKENASLRKQARFLLEAAVREALAAQGAEAEVKRCCGSVSAGEVSSAWKAIWEFADTLEEFSSHLLKSSWDTLMSRIMQYLKRLAAGKAAGGSSSRRWPPAVFAPAWLEVVLCRALAHDNDTVHRYVLGQLLALDQGVASFSEAFVLGEMLPRFSHSIDILYPRSDVHQTFEKQTADFFAAFVERHPEGAQLAARRLLFALLEDRTVHHTPLRLILSVLKRVAPTARGALSHEEALALAERAFDKLLVRMPISTRPALARLALDVAEGLCAGGGGADGAGAALVEQLARTAASIPDALLPELRGRLAALASRAVGASSLDLVADLVRGLTSASGPHVPATNAAEAAGREASPMGAAHLTLGAVRLVWALAPTAGTNGGSEATAAASSAAAARAALWPSVEAMATDAHRRPYLPRRASCATLFAAAYGAALLSSPSAEAEGGGDGAGLAAPASGELLALAEAGARRALALASPAEVEEEAPWVWLYALALERLSRPFLGPGEALLVAAAAALREARGGTDMTSALVVAAAASILGALAPKVPDASRRAEVFFLLWGTHIKKPASVHDVRFSIAGEADLGAWHRNRLEEYEEPHRPNREGLGRILEWRDVVAVFLLAKWRALAALARSEGCPEALKAQETSALGSPGALAEGVLEELETLQPPHVAFWAPVARRVAYPAFFGTASEAGEERQREALQRLCAQLRGSVMESTGDGSTYMGRGCMAELSAALCDPQLCEAERRLFPDDDALGPVTGAMRALLSGGEVAVGVSRAVVAPALSALFACEGSSSGAAEVLSAVLLHREATIVDGALSLAPDVAVDALDADGPGGAGALAAVCGGAASASALSSKFRGTSGLPRVLALAGLDGLVERAAFAGGGPPALVADTLRRLLAVLRETLRLLLNPPGGKVVANRPPTPMPMSTTHRTQLRGWQAVLLLGSRSDRSAAEFLLPELFHHLAVPHVPDVRDCQELLGCALCANFEELAVEPFLVPALRNFDAQTQVSASLLVIASFLFKRWATSAKADGAWGSQSSARISALVRAVAPYLSHNSAYVRGTAAWGFFEIFEALGVEKLTEHVGAADAGLLKDLYTFVASNKECKKMRGRLRPVFADLDPGRAGLLSRLTEQSSVLPPSEGAGDAVAPAASPLYMFTDGEFQPTSTFLNLLKDEVAHEMETLVDRLDVTQYPSLSENWQHVIDAALRPKEALEEDPSPPCVQASAGGGAGAGAGDGGAIGTQRKFVPPAPPEPPATDEDGAGAGAAAGRSRLPLVVIGSLIDKTPNLAGLCRTCEVFNCEAVCLANAKITKDQAFQSISVTAEKWLPIREVPRASLKSYLLEMRRRGYAVVGIEQTHNSVQMDEFKFPPNTAILLGAEKEGIDADLLPLLDGCVEIPQAGQLRSLNVHVSGSLAVWEYTRQRRAAAVAAAG